MTTIICAILGRYLRVPMIGAATSLVGIFLIALTGAYWHLLKPARLELDREKAALTEQNRLLGIARERMEQGERFGPLSDQVSRLRARMAIRADASYMVEKLARYSAESGARILHGATSAEEKAAGLTVITQDLTIEGSYSQIRLFLDRIAGIETLTILYSAELTANPDGTLVRARAKLKTTYSKAGRGGA